MLSWHKTSAALARKKVNNDGVSSQLGATRCSFSVGSRQKIARYNRHSRKSERRRLRFTSAIIIIFIVLVASK